MLLEIGLDTNKKYNKTGEKQVYYFSMEFLLGRLLGDCIIKYRNKRCM